MKNIDIVSLARKNVVSLSPYASARDDFKGQASVFLDANENPYPSTLNRYPDPHQHLLKSAIARLKEINPENIFLGNGSDEAIDLLLRVFCEPGKDEVIIPQPTYGMYAVSAAIHDIAVRAPALDERFDLDAPTVLGRVNSHTKLIFLCSPNNPTGNLLNPGAIHELLNAFNGLVVIDEAYIDFAGAKSWVQSIQDHANLVVLQTLSKAWGLAGIRLGMCFAHRMVIDLLNKIKSPYNISTRTQQDAIEKIERGSGVMKSHVQEILAQRDYLSRQLTAAPQVTAVFPSEANFLLVKVDNPKKMYTGLAEQGIIVRDRSREPGCEGCLRITIGTKEENARLVKAILSL